jgi:hypothetical protein
MKKFWDKADSLYKKIGLIIGIVVIVPTVLTMLSGMIASIMIVLNIEDYVKRYETATEHVLSTQGVIIDALGAEMDKKKIDGIPVRATNEGDLWIIKTELINGKERKVIYSGHYRASEHNIGYFDFNNQHHWIKKKSE